MAPLDLIISLIILSRNLVKKKRTGALESNNIHIYEAHFMLYKNLKSLNGKRNVHINRYTGINIYI
jgi:hypothetical protein